MKKNNTVILRGPGGLAALGLYALLCQGIFIFCAIILIGVPCWFIGRMVARAKRKKMIAQGMPAPLPPSLLRKTVQNIVSAAMAVLWCVLIYLIVSNYAWPFFSVEPLKTVTTCLVLKDDEAKLRPSAISFNEVVICPVGEGPYTTSELASTCNAAAKYFYKKYARGVRVEISICPAQYKSYGYYKELGLNYPWQKSLTLGGIDDYCRLAICTYDPKDRNKWLNFAVVTNADKLQCEINSLWVEHEDMIVNKNTEKRWEKLQKYVAKKLDIPFAEAWPRKFQVKDVPDFLIPVSVSDSAWKPEELSEGAETAEK